MKITREQAELLWEAWDMIGNNDCPNPTAEQEGLFATLVAEAIDIEEDDE